MVSIFIVLFISLPIVIFYFTTKWGFKHDIVNYFIIEGIIVFILITITNVYFYKKYTLNFLPATEQIVTDIFVLLFFALLFYVGSFLWSLFTSKERFGFKMVMMIFTFAIAVIILIVPVTEKYEYSQRIHNMDEMLKLNDSKYIKEIDGLKILLVDSSRQSRVRTRYNTSSPNYRSYFYVKNTNDTFYKGRITLTVYGKDHNYIDNKTTKNIELAPGDIEFLTIDKEIHYHHDVWNEKTFVSKDRVHYFNAHLVSD